MGGSHIVNDQWKLEREKRDDDAKREVIKSKGEDELALFLAGWRSDED